MKTFQSASSGLPALPTIGSSCHAQQARAQVYYLSQRNDCVLIVGPEGSGRESLARAIHAASARRNQPFIALHCGDLTEGLFFDSQVFGHLPGAFLGLQTSSLGLIQAAQGGTLFLRDVELLELESQWKLLRALEDQKVVPLGGREAIPVDIRVIASTGADLASGVEDGTFRGDFLEWLSQNLLEVGRLADRMEDLPALAEEVVREISARRKLPARRFSPSATDWLGRYEWPGNLRELRKAIDAAITNDTEEIDARSLRLALRKVHAGSAATVARRPAPVRFTGFAAMRTALASRCQA